MFKQWRMTILFILMFSVLMTGFPATAIAKEISLDVAPGHRVLMAGQKQKAYLRVAMTGFELDDAAKRPPVNVSFVIDRSGSMGGPKIAEAKRAVILAMDRLRDDDIVSVVTYNSTVQVLVPATRLRDRASIYSAIDRVAADGSTALFAGVSKGAAELRKFLEKDQVNRLVLLSDGLANVGPSSPGELADLGKSLGRDGITVSTIGLGLGYNEDLMVRLAQASDGNHMFAENASDLQTAFAKEFGDVLTVVAQHIKVDIHCADGVRPVRTLGREADIVGQDVSFTLNQLYGGQQKYALLEVEVPPSAVGHERKLASLTVSYLNMATGQATTLSGDTAISFTDKPEAMEASANTEVMVAVAMQIGVEQNKFAMELRDEGKIEEARKVLISNTAYLDEKAKEYKDEGLQDWSARNGSMVIQWDGGDWTKQRKQMRYDQHEIATQQQP